MKSQLIAELPTHKWIYFGRDPDKPHSIIDTNQYMVVTENQAMLMDPGGIELFAPMLASVVKHIPLEQLTHLFASHQDPDIISSLGLWDQTLPRAKLYSPWIWEGFIRHFGMSNISYEAIKDQGRKLLLDDTELEFVPTTTSMHREISMSMIQKLKFSCLVILAHHSKNLKQIYMSMILRYTQNL